MEESQREAMYNGWARRKKWIRVSVERTLSEHKFENVWKACAEDKFGCIERPTKILAIQKMQGMLAEKGYEISNLAELFGVETEARAKHLLKEDKERFDEVKKHWLPKQEERRTFIEWLKKTKPVRHEWKEPVPQHELKDPSMDDKLLASQQRKLKEHMKWNKFFNDVHRANEIHIKMT